MALSNSPGQLQQTDPSLAVRFGEILNSMEKWCEQLEDLADRMPESIGECLSVSQELQADIRRAHDFEENELFVALRRVYLPDSALEATLERLHQEHYEDEGFAEEIRESLTECTLDRKRCNVESLSYMLRGFFESKRRHCAFERQFLLPLLADLDA